MRSEASVAYRRSSADPRCIWYYLGLFIFLFFSFLPFFLSCATAYIPISLALSQHLESKKTNSLDTNTLDLSSLCGCVDGEVSGIDWGLHAYCTPFSAQRRSKCSAVREYVLPVRWLQVHWTSMRRLKHRAKMTAT